MTDAAAELSIRKWKTLGRILLGCTVLVTMLAGSSPTAMLPTLTTSAYADSLEHPASFMPEEG
jgi:hypothetical protein